MPDAPEAVLKETGTFRDEEDTVGHFLRRCTVKKPEAREQAKMVYRSFCYFCKDELGLARNHIPSQKAISSDLRAQPHIERVEGRTIMYHGIELKPEWIPKDDD